MPYVYARSKNGVMQTVRYEKDEGLMIPIPLANDRILTVKVSNDILKEIVDTFTDNSKEANKMPICRDYPLERLDDYDRPKPYVAYDKTRGLIINNAEVKDGTMNLTIPREILVRMFNDILHDFKPIGSTGVGNVII